MLGENFKMEAKLQDTCRTENASGVRDGTQLRSVRPPTVYKWPMVEGASAASRCSKSGWIMERRGIRMAFLRNRVSEDVPEKQATGSMC